MEETKYKVGDTVVINLDNFDIDEDLGFYIVTDEMFIYNKQEAIVEELLEYDEVMDIQYYRLNLDGGIFAWSEDMLVRSKIKF